MHGQGCEAGIIVAVDRAGEVQDWLLLDPGLPDGGRAQANWSGKWECVLIRVGFEGLLFAPRRDRPTILQRTILRARE